MTSVNYLFVLRTIVILCYLMVWLIYFDFEYYEIVKIVNNTVERKLRDELEILKEREKGLDNLINIKIKFDNEEIFYNMIKK